MLDSDEGVFSFGHMRAHYFEPTMRADADGDIPAECDAVHVKVETTSGEVETVFALEP